MVIHIYVRLISVQICTKIKLSDKSRPKRLSSIKSKLQKSIFVVFSTNIFNVMSTEMVQKVFRIPGVSAIGHSPKFHKDVPFFVGEHNFETFMKF